MTPIYDVLVVDDDDDLRETLVDVLVEEGLVAASAKNGEVALAWLRGGKRAALILLDFAMPEMDAAAFRAVQRSDPMISDVPVVLMSASRRFTIEGEPQPLPKLLKPINLDALLALVKGYSEKSHAGRT